MAAISASSHAISSNALAVITGKISRRFFGDYVVADWTGAWLMLPSMVDQGGSYQAGIGLL